MHADRERLAHLLNRLAVPPAEADPAVLAEVHQALKLWDRIFARATSGEEPLDHVHLHALAEALAHLHRVGRRSEEHTSELQSLLRISYAVFCLNKKKKKTKT